MAISLEKIDELRRRTNCSYEEAKILLEKHNGDLLEAIVEFEKTHRPKYGHHYGKGSASGFGSKVKEWIHKGFKTKFVIEKSGETIINIPVNILIIAAVFLNWVLLAALIVLLFFGFKLSFRKDTGKVIDINKMMGNFGMNEEGEGAKKTGEQNNRPKRDDDKEYNEFTVE